MIRLVLLLCAGLFATLLIAGGEDGQKRLGLRENTTALPRMARIAPVPDEAPRDENFTQNTPPPQSAPPAPSQSLPLAALIPVGSAAATGQPMTAAQSLPQAGPQRIGDVKYISARMVNVRAGPSTQDAVLGKLRRGEAVTILWSEDNGWARIRIEGDGIDGFVSMNLLSDNPS